MNMRINGQVPLIGQQTETPKIGFKIQPSPMADPALIVEPVPGGAVYHQIGGLTKLEHGALLVVQSMRLVPVIDWMDPDGISQGVVVACDLAQAVLAECAKREQKPAEPTT